VLTTLLVWGAACSSCVWEAKGGSNCFFRNSSSTTIRMKKAQQSNMSVEWNVSRWVINWLGWRGNWPSQWTRWSCTAMQWNKVRNAGTSNVKTAEQLNGGEIRARPDNSLSFVLYWQCYERTICKAKVRYCSTSTLARRYCRKNTGFHMLPEPEAA